MSSSIYKFVSRKFDKTIGNGSSGKIIGLVRMRTQAWMSTRKSTAPNLLNITIS